MKHYKPLSLENAKIYKLVSNNTGKYYIGSTCADLTLRLWQHYKDYKIFSKGEFHYLSSFDVVKDGNVTIELLEKVECNNRYDLNTKEKHYISNSCDNCVNKYGKKKLLASSEGVTVFV